MRQAQVHKPEIQIKLIVAVVVIQKWLSEITRRLIEVIHIKNIRKNGNCKGWIVLPNAVILCSYSKTYKAEK